MLSIFHVQGSVLHILFPIFIANLLGTCYYEPFRDKEKWLGKAQDPARSYKISRRAGLELKSVFF